jgi:hypothetical protein
MPDLDGMMPDTDPGKERVRQGARVGICITTGAMLVFLIIQPGWTWVPLAFVISISALSVVARTGSLPRAPASSDDVGPRGLAAGAARPAAPGIMAVVGRA